MLLLKSSLPCRYRSSRHRLCCIFSSEIPGRLSTTLKLENIDPNPAVHPVLYRLHSVTLKTLRLVRVPPPLLSRNLSLQLQAQPLRPSRRLFLRFLFLLLFLMLLLALLLPARLLPALALAAILRRERQRSWHASSKAWLGSQHMSASMRIAS